MSAEVRRMRSATGWPWVAGVVWLLAGVAVSAQQPARAPSAPGTRMVQVDGRAMRVQVLGLERRAAGSPIVVFEAGAANSLDIWANVLPDVAREHPVVAYDRAGLGQSEWDGVRPTPQHVVARLRKALAAIGAKPPYVLVGFSWGGTLVRYFAGLHPTEVAGLVFVDPGPIVTQTHAEKLAPFDSVGVGQAGYDAYWDGYAGFFERASPAIREEFAVFKGLMDLDLDRREVRPLPDVPVVVLVATKYLPPPAGLPLPFDPRAHFEIDARHRIRMLQSWVSSSSNGTLAATNHSTHAIPREDPGLVVWAVRRVLSAIAQRR